MNLRSFTFRMILWYSLLLGIVSCGFGVYTYYGLKHYLTSSLQFILMQRATQIANSLLPRIHQFGEDYTVAEIITLYAPEYNNRFIRISRNNGSVLYESGVPKDSSFDPHKVSLPDRTASTAMQRHERNTNAHDIYIATVPVKAKDHAIFYWIEVGAADHEIKNALLGLMKTLGLAFPVLILFATGGGYMLIRRSLSPVSKIINSAEDITLSNLSRRLPVIASGDVFEHLSNALNRMIARLDDAFQQVSRFTQDASHELRTPLTIMRGELESLTQEKRLPDDLLERVGSVLEETERLAHITEGLFVISRLDAREAIMMSSVVDLGELVTSTVDQILLLAEEKGLRLDVEATKHAYVQGDPHRIKQIIINLLDNAIKYTHKGQIMATVRTAYNKAIFEVRDTGIGISEENLPYIFDRFYRVDKARSRDNGGAGLGLSIVRSLCLVHEGTLMVKSEEGKGSVFIVELPLADPKHAGLMAK